MNTVFPDNERKRDQDKLRKIERTLAVLDEKRFSLIDQLTLVRQISLELDAFYSFRMASWRESPLSFFGKKQQQISEMVEKCHRLSKRRDEVFQDRIVPALQKAGVRIVSGPAAESVDATWITRRFESVIFPALTPLVVDASHPFPQLQSGSMNLAVTLKRDGRACPGLIQMPRLLPRCYLLANEPVTMILLEDLITFYVNRLFSDPVLGVTPFRVIRNLNQQTTGMADPTIQGHIVRLEMQQPVSAFIEKKLSDVLKLGDQEIYATSGPLDLSFLPAIERQMHLSKSFG